MHYYFTAVSLIAGICLGFGILYLFIGLRRKEDKPLNLTFALFALCYATTLFNGIRWYSATSVTEFIAISRFDSIFSAGAFVGLIWYIAYYTDIRPRIFLWALSATLIVPSLVYIISPATYTGVVSGLTNIPLPWGEKLIIWDIAGSIWRDTIQLARLVTLGYIIFALIQQFWRGERQPAIILGLGILPFIVGIFYEILGQTGVVPFIPFGEIGFLGIAFAASLQMTNSVIRTEEQLDRHQQNLAGLVEARTAELRQSNESLAGEIAGRVRTEEALRESEYRFRSFIEQSSEGIMLLDEEGSVIEWNRGVEQLTGLKREAVLGKPQWDIQYQLLADARKTPEAYERFKSTMLEALQTGQAPWMNRSIEASFQQVDGSERVIQQRLFPIKTDQGFRIGGISTDITERQRAEAALRESEEKFRNLAEQSPNMIFINQNGRVVYTNQKCTEILGYTREEFHAEDFDFLALIAPDCIDVVKEKFRRHLHGENVPAYEYALITKGGERIDAINSTALISYEGEHAILGTVTDITERVRAEQTLGRRVEELAFLHQTAQILTSVTDLSTALEQVAEMVAYLFDARSTRITVPADGEKELKILVGFVRDPVPDEATTISAYPLAEMPNTRDVFTSGELRVIYDLQALSLAPPIREVVTELNLHSIMLVPLMVHGTPRGILSVSTDQPGREFTPDEVQLAETIASDIAAAIENARLLEQAKAAAAVEERNRIARELHDSVTQSMYSVSIVAEALPRMLERNLAEAKRNAAYLRQTTLGALAEMRTLLFELRPGTLAKARLNVLLQQLADVLTGRTRVPVEVTLSGDLALPVNVKIALYRIAQEAFNNINKHAQASQVWVRLYGQPDEVLLTIRDNGRGFDLDSIPEERLGLQIMRERAEEIGASFKVESEPGQGTQVSVSWLAAGAGAANPDSLVLVPK